MARALGDQMLEPGRQLERVGCAKLAVDRRVARAIVAADDESDVVAEGLMDVAADVIVCPGYVELEIEIADSIVPRSVVLRGTRDLLRLGLEGMAGGAHCLVLGIAALARRAVGNEHDDGEHRQRDQCGDGKGDLPLKATSGRGGRGSQERARRSPQATMPIFLGCRG